MSDIAPETDPRCDVTCASFDDDIDVERILARCEQRTVFSRRKCLYQAPEFVQRLPATETVAEGSSVNFGCKVFGFPVPSITWYKDDEELPPDARATTGIEEPGSHTLSLSNVSKCDGGTYKIKATNLEGSSSSSLYITVKAKSKLRNRKKAKRSRQVARVPLFPAIIEVEADERRETLETELQPDSPLTPMYCTISRKTPVMWPAFLGDWAYNSSDVLRKDEIEAMDAGNEDVFDSETESENTEITRSYTKYTEHGFAELKHKLDMSNPEHPVTLTCKAAVSKPQCTDMAGGIYFSAITKTPISTVVGNESGDEHVNKQPHDNGLSELDDMDTSAYRRCQISEYISSSNNEAMCDILNNNSHENALEHHAKHAVFKDSENICAINGDAKYYYDESEPVTSISVHRSYATGSSALILAKRSPSPFSCRSVRRSPLSSQTGSEVSAPDVSHLQNLNNERILRKMQGQRMHVDFIARVWKYCAKNTNHCTWDDILVELIFLICAGTYVALVFDVAPSYFVLAVILILLLKLVATHVLQSS
ncbi:uncharacterized protein LOC127847337 isoform X2 [Dreissena polymorpha]|uniref:uncharacterized protein LOC127847337 isoform X2 n=1 Tax=Dreissena polymorpha TaxID=45954 RepID=UPI002263E8D0|nr:uncharacterized protein LOC127847337 isoform X2 [Dreissena polymorpha]